MGCCVGSKSTDVRESEGRNVQELNKEGDVYNIRDEGLVSGGQEMKKASEEDEIKAEEFKKKGNELFTKGEFNKAVSKYKKAIGLNPKVSIYHSNSAICYYKLKKYFSAYEHAKKAHELDSKNFKALVYCIKSSASLALEGDIEQFNIAMNHCREIKKFKDGTNDSYISNYAKTLKSKVKYILTHVNLANRKTQLLNYYKSLYNNPHVEQLERVLEFKPYEMNSLFCPLTLEIFEDPVCLSTGNTFEKRMIEVIEGSHNLIDPLTREMFNKRTIPNNSIIQALHWYSKAFPEVAFQYDKNDCEL